MAISSTIMRNNLKRGPRFIGLVCGGGYGKDPYVASKERIARRGTRPIQPRHGCETRGGLPAGGGTFGLNDSTPDLTGFVRLTCPSVRHFPGQIPATDSVG